MRRWNNGTLTMKVLKHFLKYSFQAENNCPARLYVICVSNTKHAQKLQIHRDTRGSLSFGVHVSDHTV